MSKSASGNHATTDRLLKRLQESMDRFAKTAGKAEKRMRHEAGDTKARVSKAGEKARKRSEKTVHSVSVFVRDNPLTSLGLALAAGSLMSAIARRS